MRLFRDLTRGPDDVYAIRNEGVWGPTYSEMDDRSITLHLTGYMEIGSYPLIPADPWSLCYWIGADFDGKESGDQLWRSDVARAAEFFSEFDGCFINLSRSGKGAHIRMLFTEAVPAWMARRWMAAWLDESGVLRNVEYGDIAPTFDRLIPPQDQLSTDHTKYSKRGPGNLMGSPLNPRCARNNGGGTMPLDPRQVERGNFEPDGKHWDHVVRALESRSWGFNELQRALDDCPGDVSKQPPTKHSTRSLPILPSGEGELDQTLAFCDFMRAMQGENMNYQLWVALASQLHRFGEAGREAFHAISATDHRYNVRNTERKWQQTRGLSPVRCDTLVSMGFRCPHLDTPRCNGATSPATFWDFTYSEIL